MAFSKEVQEMIARGRAQRAADGDQGTANIDRAVARYRQANTAHTKPMASPYYTGPAWSPRDHMDAEVGRGETYAQRNSRIAQEQAEARARAAYQRRLAMEEAERRRTQPTRPQGVYDWGNENPVTYAYDDAEIPDNGWIAARGVHSTPINYATDPVTGGYYDQTWNSGTISNTLRGFHNSMAGQRAADDANFDRYYQNNPQSQGIDFSGLRVNGRAIAGGRGDEPTF